MKKSVLILIVFSVLVVNTFGWSQDRGVPGLFYETSFSSCCTLHNAEFATKGRYQSNGVLVAYKDADTQVFGFNEEIDRTISNALYVASSATDADGNFVESGKDLHAIMAVAIAKTTKWDARGVMAFGGTSVQLGSGVATNEFWALQPDWAIAKSSQLVGAFAVIAPNYTDCGSSDYTALECVNAGTKQAQNAISAHGNFNAAVNLEGVKAANVGIKMPRGTVQGSIIEYGNNTYTYFNGSAFIFVIKGEVVGKIGD